MYEEIRLEKVEGFCGRCEEYAKKNMTTPTKIAIMSCEGACTRGEISRRAANLIAYKLSPENTVRICLGSAFTKEGGQRDLVRKTHKAIAIEGCFVSCSSRMMKGAIPELKPVVVHADEIHNRRELPFGANEVSDEVFNDLAKITADEIVAKYVLGNADATAGAKKCSSCSSCKFKMSKL